MNLSRTLALLHEAQVDLAGAFRRIGAAHQDEPDVRLECERFAAQCERHAVRLAAALDRYGAPAADEPRPLHSVALGGPRTGSFGLLRDLQELYVLAAECDITWTLVGQAAKGARDDGLDDTVAACEGETAVQLSWLRTRLKSAAPQVLVVD